MGKWLNYLGNSYNDSYGGAEGNFDRNKLLAAIAEALERIANALEKDKK
jgi:hypothetical protein